MREPRRTVRTQWFGLTTTLALLVVVSTQARAQLRCDAQLTERATGRYGYRERGNRCEGKYGEPVRGASDLLLVSYSEVVGEIEIRRKTSLHLGWPALGDGARHLRAEGLGTLLYRMDTALPASADSVETFEWPARLLYAIGARQEDIGVVAWTSYPMGDEELQVYLPVVLSSEEGRQPRGQPELILLTRIAADEILLTVDRFDAEGRPLETVLADSNLCPYRCSATRLPHTVDYLDTPGIYRLTFTVKPWIDDFDESTEYFWVYYDGPRSSSAE